jgi:hypothetical protein
MCWTQPYTCFWDHNLPSTPEHCDQPAMCSANSKVQTLSTIKLSTNRCPDCRHLLGRPRLTLQQLLQGQLDQIVESQAYEKYKYYKGRFRTLGNRLAGDADLWDPPTDQQLYVDLFVVWALDASAAASTYKIDQQAISQHIMQFLRDNPKPVIARIISTSIHSARFSGNGHPIRSTTVPHPVGQSGSSAGPSTFPGPPAFSDPNHPVRNPPSHSPPEAGPSYTAKRPIKKVKANPSMSHFGATQDRAISVLSDSPVQDEEQMYVGKGKAPRARGPEKNTPGSSKGRTRNDRYNSRALATEVADDNNKKHLYKSEKERERFIDVYTAFALEDLGEKAAGLKGSERRATRTVDEYEVLLQKTVDVMWGGKIPAGFTFSKRGREIRESKYKGKGKAPATEIQQEGSPSLGQSSRSPALATSGKSTHNTGQSHIEQSHGGARSRASSNDSSVSWNALMSFSPSPPAGVSGSPSRKKSGSPAPGQPSPNTAEIEAMMKEHTGGNNFVLPSRSITPLSNSPANQSPKTRGTGTPPGRSPGSNPGQAFTGPSGSSGPLRQRASGNAIRGGSSLVPPRTTPPVQQGTPQRPPPWNITPASTGAPPTRPPPTTGAGRGAGRGAGTGTGRGTGTGTGGRGRGKGKGPAGRGQGA